ncbi:lysophospholipid acyltransferase family protein [Ferruginibacter yonginensis]|uniref:Lysophospholipid acyltransferase family protein n=1 Tax=Ferruginibacter yonginensis TaxID=1310416 RepID=A0ABV8QLZ5_9BACT
MKNIFARIWAAWALVTFVISFLIIFIPSMFSYLFKDYAKGQYYFIKVSKIWMRFWLAIIGCPVRVHGLHHFKKGENYIVVYNHNALLDVPLSAPFVPGPNKTIAKASFAKVPIFSWFYKRGGIMVDRKTEGSRVKSFEAMKQTLKKGIHMCIYPEGTRNRTNQPLKPFYDGAFKLAIDTQKEIIPCVMIGTNKAMPINKTFYLLPHKLEMYYLEPVSPVNIDTKSLNNKVYDIMKNKWLQHN